MGNLRGKLSLPTASLRGCLLYTDEMEGEGGDILERRARWLGGAQILRGKDPFLGKEGNPSVLYLTSKGKRIHRAYR